MKQNNIYFILICLFFFFSCDSKRTIIPSSDLHLGDRLFLEAEAEFAGHCYEKATELYKEYLVQFPRGPKAPGALMKMGIIHMFNENYKLARDTFNNIIAQFPGTDFSLDARNKVLETYYAEGSFWKVIEQGQGVLKEAVLKKDLKKTYSLLAKVYSTIGFEEKAVYSYYMAYDHSRAEAKESMLVKLKEYLAPLDVGGVENILGNIENVKARGYFLYLKGVVDTEEEKYERATYSFSRLIQNYPEDKNAGSAVNILKEIQHLSYYNHHTIGCLLPLSGPFKTYGNRALRGIEIALFRFNAKNPGTLVKLIIKDTGSDDKKAVLAVEELYHEKTAAIIGPILTAAPAAVTAQTRGIPIITITQKENIADIGSYVFRNFFTPEMQVRTIVSYATGKLGLSDFAILYPDDKYGKSFMNIFWDEVIKQDGKIVAIESYNTDQTDFAKSIKKLAGLYYDIPQRLVTEKVEENPEEIDNNPSAIVNFEAIFIPEEPKRAGLIVPQLAYYDIKDITIFGTNLWHSHTLVEMAREYVQGAIMPDIFFAESSLPQVKEFVKVFEDTFQNKPGFIEAVAYDTATILFQAVIQPDIYFRSSLRDEILKRQDFPGVTGETSFGTNGDAFKELYLLQIKGKKFEEIE